MGIYRINLNFFFNFGVYLVLITTAVLLKNEVNLSCIWNFCLILINSELNWVVFIILLYKDWSIIWIYGLLLSVDYFNFSWWTNNNTQITATLTNGFFLVHPVFIFFMYLLAIQLISMRNYSKIKSYKYSMLAINAIFLGAWWANQELGWGGWWSWDLVEVINLILVLLGVQKLHESTKTPDIVLKKLKSFFGLFFFHLCIRYDLFNSIHTFTAIFLIEYTNFFTYILICLNIIILAKIKYVVIELNNIYTKFLIFLYCISITFYNINFISTQSMWVLYLFSILNILMWCGLKKTYLLNIVFCSYNFWYFLLIVIWNFLKKFKSNSIHFTLCFSLFVYFFKTQVDYISDYFYTDSVYIYINGDFSFLNTINSIEAWFNFNILDGVYLNNLTYIPFYHYILFIKLFLTTNFTNLTYFNYYFDLFFITYIIIVSKLFKNVIEFYTKYKIWCI